MSSQTKSIGMALPAATAAEAPARKRRQSRRLVDALIFAAPIVALLLLWELLALAGVIDNRILPAPHLIAARAFELMSSESRYVLLVHVGYSIVRALVAFVVAAIVAVPLGFLLGLSRTTYDWTAPVLSMLLPLPAVAWTPIFLVSLGRGDLTIVCVCFLGAFFPILYSTIQAVQGISKHSVWVVRSMGAGPLTIFRTVLLPSSLPTLVTGFKLGLAHAWRTLVAAEMLASASFGLGYMIFAARSYMDVPSMFVGIAALAVMGFLIEQILFGGIERATIRRWYPTRGKRAS